MQAEVLAPWIARKAAVVPYVPFPQIPLASRSVACPSSIQRYTGCSDLPVTTTPSNPAYFSSAPQWPPIPERE
jgi:hypothetical protein